MRDYLVRMVGDLRTAGSDEQIGAAVTRLVKTSSEETAAQAARDAKKRAAELKSLIIKTADEVYEEIDRITTVLSSEYLAISEFGTYQEEILTTIEQTARSTVESYQYAESIEAINQSLESHETYITLIDGRIQRGILTDPDTGLDVMGIAISENLQFTGEVVDQEGTNYYRLEEGQTLGLYTSTGWTFWINGRRMGWFSSVDSSLHLANIVVESKLQMGADWLITTTGGFGLRYIGGE